MEQRNQEGLTEKEFLLQYHPGNYERPSVTVDMLIFTVDEEEMETEILLIKRKKIIQHRTVGNSGRFCKCR